MLGSTSSSSDFPKAMAITLFFPKKNLFKSKSRMIYRDKPCADEVLDMINNKENTVRQLRLLIILPALLPFFPDIL
jgi:hypothetical protein